MQHGHGADNSAEELLDVFKAAALSVTKLYKTASVVQSKARVDGYQDCLEDLLALLDKGDVDARTIRRWVVERLDGREPIAPTVESEDEVDKTDSGGSGSGVASRRQDGDGGRGSSASSDTVMQTEAEAESEETETETTPTPTKKTTTTTTTRAAATTTGTTTAAAATPSSTTATPPAARTRGSGFRHSPSASRKAAKAAARSAASEPAAIEIVEPPEVSAPMQDNFTFRAAVPYPSEPFLELANLDLSDRRPGPGSVKDAAMMEPPLPSSSASSASSSSSSSSDAATATATATAATYAETSPSPSHAPPSSGSRQFRVRHGASRSAVRSALTARSSRSSAGQKRKLNFDEIFDLASLGYGRDVFGRGGGKRPRQA